MKSRTRSNDVARLAGVSRSTVSRVFTDGAYASQETRQRVLDAANRLGYSPNAIARSLTTRSTQLIGVIVGELENPFYAGILQALAEALQQRNLASLLFVTAPKEIDQLIPRVLSYQVDGVVITESILSSRMAARCQEAGIPVVLVNRYVDSDVLASVVGDNVDGARQIARHLLAIGRRRIAYMAGLPDASSSRDRELGFAQALAESGRTIAARDVGHYTQEGGRDAARRLLRASRRPDALFCANDVMAVAAIDVARSEFGLQVPADLAVAGYDNSILAQLPAYRLTSVEQDSRQMAGKAVELLLDEPGSLPRSLRIAARLVTRHSTTGND